MESALNYLQTLMDREYEVPALIMLQEMTELNIDLVKSTPWVQERFDITDIATSSFDSSYGVTTLIDKRIPVIDVFRVRWSSSFGRDGLFVDVGAPTSGNGGNSDEAQKKSIPATIRLCNTHLESLPSDSPVRPIQARNASSYLHTEEIHGAVLAGDMNSIQQSDENIARENNLNDAYLELGGVDRSEDGFTWGYQSSRPVPEHHKGRLDKVFYCGALVAKKIKRIGVGLVIEDEDFREDMKKIGHDGWVTDHYGLMSEFEVLDKVG